MTHGHSDNDGEEIQVEIRCPVCSRALSILRCFAKSVAEDAGFEGEDLDQIEMAVDEACANVVCHAYKQAKVTPGTENECIISLRITVRSDMLKFQVVDYGIGINRTGGKGVASVEEFVQRGGGGGLGTYIMQRFMDEVQYDFPEDRGTVVTMTKYLKTGH